MKRIYDGQVGQIVPAQSGVVMAIGEKTFGGQIAVSYMFYSFSMSMAEKVDRSVYLEAKFGPYYKQFISLFDDFINCHIANLYDDKKIAILPDGSAFTFDETGRVYQRADFKYNNSLPQDVAFDGKYVWVSYPEINCVIKYDPKTLRMLFRVGAEQGDAFVNPCGLSMFDNKLMVCCSEEKEIKSLDVDKIKLDTYLRLNETVYRYYKVGVNEVILLENGVYIL